MKPLFTGKLLYTGNWVYSCLLTIPQEGTIPKKPMIATEGDNLKKVSRACARTTLKTNDSTDPSRSDFCARARGQNG